MAFSWKRAFKHAAIPCALVFVAGMALSMKAADPEKLGEGTGQFMVVVFLASVGASYLVQIGRKRTAIALAAGFVALVVAAVIAVWPEGHRKLPAGFRAPLMETSDGGQRRLEQPALGFSIRHPGEGFVEKPDYAARAAAASRDPDTLFYAYARTEPTAILLVTLTADVSTTRASLEQFLDGIDHGVRESARKQLGSAAPPALARDVVWTDRRHEASLSGAVGDVGYRVRVFARPRFTLAVMVMSSDPAALAPVLDDVRF